MRKITYFKTMLAAVMLLVGSAGLFGQYAGTGTFSKITTVDEIQSGAYYVLYGTNTTYTGALSNEISGGRFKAATVTSDGNSIVNPPVTVVWKIEGDATNGYTIYNEDSDKFCEITTSSTSGFAANNPSTHTYTATVADGNFSLKSNSATGGNRVIAIYQTDFRPYTTGNTLHLYKLPASVDPTVVLNPIISVNGVEKTPGVYYNEAQVTLSTETAGASIYYTVNGDEPTTASTLYTAPFTVTATATVKALAVKSAMTNSAVMQRLITIVSPAVGTLPFEELFNASLNDFYAFSKTGDQIWGPSSYSSGTYPTFAKVSGYSGGNKENEDWLISPKFTASAALGLQLSFASATGFAGNALQLKYSTNYSGFGDPSNATWTDITSQASWPAENSSYAWVESGNIVIAGTMPVHFAFVYTSTTTAAATWEVANVKVINVPVGPTITVTEVSVPAMQAMVGASSTSTIHVSGINLTANVSLAVSGKNANRFSVSPASLTQTGGVVENTNVTITYTPSAEVADTATLTLSSAGASSVVFELTGKGIVLAGAGTTENPFTVADVKKLNNSFASATKYWVRGYIIGVPSAGNAEGNLTTVDLEPEFTGVSAIALSDTETETDLTKMIGVQLPTGAVRTALNLVDNAANYKKLVKVFGTLEAYFTAAPGVKNVTEYMFIETSIPKVDANDFKVYTSAGKLQVDAVESGEIVVFDVIGKQIYKGSLQAGNNSINLPHRGVMVVKINNSTAKVVL
ncbi:MAG: DUF6359 domain-containing protein [Paludibacter sp.]|nr:DUF6359 domain-containing protein [Paludibacter sp.]